MKKFQVIVYNLYTNDYTAEIVLAHTMDEAIGQVVSTLTDEQQFDDCYEMI